MNSSKMLRMMQPLRAQALALGKARTPVIRAQASAFTWKPRQTRGLRIQSTKPMMRPVPKEDQSAHTISQRLRTLKRMPPELIPLFVVVAFAVFAACFALARKLTSDKTLRLWRPEKKKSHAAEH